MSDITLNTAAAAVPGVREGNVAAVRLPAVEGGPRESFAVLVESRASGDPAAEERIGRETTARVVAELLKVAGVADDYEALDETSLSMLTAAKNGTLDEFLTAHPEFSAETPATP